jgi:hypothetical protein
MSHFAELDLDNTVLRVIVGNDKKADEGLSWIEQNLGGTWIQTSYNGRIRKNFAGVGYKYDEVLDAFIPPKPFESWTLNEETCLWEAPVAMPLDGKDYYWDELTTGWLEVIGEN